MKMNISKVVMLGGAAIVSVSASSAFAADTGACDATAGQVTSAVVDSGDAGAFVQESFTINCSANVMLNWAGADGTQVAARAGSKKGMHTFGASTKGGSVRACETASIATPHTAATVTAGTDGCS